MTSKHTPGPWLAIEYETGLGWSVRANGTRVANVDGYSADELEPNAHLIAAAPEMLRMLKDLFCVSLYEQTRDTHQSLWDIVQATIDKAEGK